MGGIVLSRIVSFVILDDDEDDRSTIEEPTGDVSSETFDKQLQFVANSVRNCCLSTRFSA